MRRASKEKGQENAGSFLLSLQENERLEDLLGRRCVVSSEAFSTKVNLHFRGKMECFS